MKTEPIKVKRWITEANDKLMPIIRKVIEEKEKLHISAPVGTGKTTFAINVSEEYIQKGYIILMVFPTIGISEQVKIEFDERKIKIDGEPISVSIYNSKEKIEEIIYDEVILSTMDGAHKILKDEALEHKQVIIFLDETHYILQNARENFQKSVTAIMESKYPIIGFSATPNTWVNNTLLGIQNNISIDVEELPDKIINPIKVEAGLQRYVAEEYSKTDGEKWVMFMEKKKDQYRMKELLQENNPNLKVNVLNADTKYDGEEKTWKKLMKTGKLPLKYDVVIINSVAQTGLNLKNPNIDRVLLVGHFDPYGFVQYLGRVRNYNKEYYYYFNDSGRKWVKGANNETINREIEKQESLVDAFKYYNKDWEPEKMMELFPETITKDTDGNNQLNKPIIASKMYKMIGELTGEILTQVIMTLGYDYIKFNQISNVNGINGKTPIKRITDRKKLRKDLVKLIDENYPALRRLAYKLLETNSHNEVMNIINDANVISKPGQHFNKGKYYVKNNKEKISLIKIIQLAKKCGISVRRLNAALAIYDRTDKSRDVLKLYIESSKHSVEGIYKAIKFFKIVKPRLLKTLSKSSFKSIIGEYHHKSGWINEIAENSLSSLKDELTEQYYEFFMRFKYKEIMDEDGNRHKYKELVGFNLTLDDYLEYKGILKEFLPSTT